MRIDQRQSAPLFEILSRERLNQGRLSGPALSDKEDMRKTFLILKAGQSIGAAKVGTGKANDLGNRQVHAATQS